ncbi:MAG TPA: M23 family metallopeptidase [Candidatus Binatia bacterium]|nr:M23 family metallopeptidase [Candidatus Binatia bacterium]
MRPPFSVVVVHGDGSRVLRVDIPRWIVWSALGLQAAVLTAVVGLSRDHAGRAARMEALSQHVADQGTLLESFRNGMPRIRDEVAGWKALHARMWKIFVPGAEPPGTDGPDLEELERAVSRTGRLLSTLPLRWPVHGPVRSEFGPRLSPWSGKREHHNGIDIGSPPGTPVVSPGAGTVVSASTQGRLGRHVTLDHGNGVRSLYGHLQAVDVSRGDAVEKGQVLGRVGNTGRSTGPHLHYELLVEGKPVDPRGFLPQR